MSEKFLPIGTVVKLHNKKNKYIIMGFLSGPKNDIKNYDYFGSYYPEGFLGNDHLCFFDSNAIEKIYHMGYVNEDELNFKKELDNFLKGDFNDKG